jgi:putative toxin-antitoxin system antitoxin component (TIGR02293 family)
MSDEMENTKPELLEEPLAAYGLTVPASGIYQLLGAAKHAGSSSDFDLLQLTRQGLPKKLLATLARKISITLQELAHIMHISDRTLQRYDDDALVKTEYAEKAVELARLYTRGQEVFGSLDKFKSWMKTPLYVFKNETPISLLDTSIGFDMVFKELGRIEHGIFA